MKAENPVCLETLKKNLLVAQELSFAKVLAGNDKTLRERAIKKLRRWLTACSNGKCEFTEEDFQRIWTGLFYCMWMSDKFLVQEDVAEKISSLVHCFSNNIENGLKFIQCFNKTMVTEWVGLDQHRIDKFNMLIRRFLRQSLQFCHQKSWNDSLVKRLVAVFEDTVFNADCPQGYLLHFIDIFPEELAKVSRGKIKNRTLLLLLEPFIKLAANTKEQRLHKGISLFFEHLIKQTDVGIEYEEKFQAWKQQGFPCRRPEQMQKHTESDDEIDDEIDEENDEASVPVALDPRAGNVDTVLPQIPINCAGILSLLSKYEHCKGVTNNGRRFLRFLKVKFTKLKRGKMPQSISKPEILDEKLKKKGHTVKCAKKLMDYTLKLQEEELKELKALEDDLSDSDDNENTGSTIVQSNSEIKGRKRNRKRKHTDEVHSNVSIQNSKKMKIQSNKVPQKETKLSKVGIPVQNGNGINTKMSSDRKLTKKNKLKLAKNKKVSKPTESVAPKSPAQTFIVEDISKEPTTKQVNSQVKAKRRNCWHIQEIGTDSDEYNKIDVPKIIKLETKISSPLYVNGTTELQVKEYKNVSVDKSKANVQLTHAFWEKAKAKVDKNSKKKDNIFLNPYYPAGDPQKNSKRISFALDKNEAQDNDDYLEEVKNSPRIPFDGSKKPTQSALKSGLLPSPINPFYRFKRR